jgi:Spy/CpxP family protein refolding chaperone
MMVWGRRAHGAECGSRECGPVTATVGFHHHYSEPGGEGGFGGGPFGVRRPLRFLAWKLGLEEAQVASLAAILDALKTERAQAAVDDRRAMGAFADLVAGETFDEARAAEAAALRTRSTERLQAQVVEALGRIHARLDVEQRARLAYLIRSGALSL